MQRTVRVKLEDRWYTVEVGDLSERSVRAVVDGCVVEVEVGEAVEESGQPRQAERRRPTRQPRPDMREAPARAAPSVSGQPASAVTESAANPNKTFFTPMPGTILSIAVAPGDQVVTGDAICVLEAMKMEQTLRADWSGVVKAVMVDAGQQVMAGAPIVELE